MEQDCIKLSPSKQDRTVETAELVAVADSTIPGTEEGEYLVAGFEATRHQPWSPGMHGLPDRIECFRGVTDRVNQWRGKVFS